MVDIATETLIPFRQVPSWCEEHLGNRIHPSTAHRWRIRGARGIKLETILAGGTRYTSNEALIRFFARTTAAAEGREDLMFPSAVLTRSIEKAEDFLNSEGV